MFLRYGYDGIQLFRYFPFSSGIADSYGAATGLKNFWFIIIDTIFVVNEVTHYLSRQS